MNVTSFVLLCVLTSNVVSVHCGIPRRPKRIIDGIPITDNNRDSPYDAVRYSVYIANHNTCPVPEKFLAWWHYINPFLRRFDKWLNEPPICHVDKWDLKCTGSLLTPKIVHTACHCVADFRQRPFSLKSYAVLRNVVETPFKIYPGQCETNNMIHYIKAKKYFVYDQCVKYVGKVIYDVGIIVLDGEFTSEKFLGMKISYVPTAPVQKIADLFNKVMVEESMCLFMGWGYFTLAGGRVEVGDLSTTLRHGWRTITTLNACKALIFGKNIQDIFLDRFPDFDFDRENTHICALSVENNSSIAGELYLIGAGDSGGPVSCHNQYFAVQNAVLGMRYSQNKIYQITEAFPVAYSYLEVAFEHRKRFTEEIEHWAQVEASRSSVTIPPPNKLRNGCPSMTSTLFTSLMIFLRILSSIC